MLLSLLLYNYSYSTVLLVGNGHQYPNLKQAAQKAVPGDTIMFSNGTHQGGEYLFGLKGAKSKPIYIIAEEEGKAIISGGNNSWQLSDPEFIFIQGLIFERQTTNGFNMDDEGDYSTPAHDITFKNCTFRDISASGNNDLLKLSGVDHFKIINCTFSNGAAGGSGIDMVGCHNGEITGNHFENMGSNAIQAKGGTQNIVISQNFFKNCGARTLNLGGNTSLQYFRPNDAKFEASDLKVFSNIFIGSDAPISYVGSVNVEVTNNTIVGPKVWAIRILQETVDPDRFLECGNNSFKNNIIYYNSIRTETNIGTDTKPNTFTFSGNLWYQSTDPQHQPSIPVPDPNIIVGKDPQFVN